MNGIHFSAIPFLLAQMPAAIPEWGPTLLNLGGWGFALWWLARQSDRRDKERSDEHKANAEYQLKIANAIERSSRALMAAVVSIKSLDGMAITDQAKIISSECDEAIHENPDRRG